jgi:hypothetical protein
MLNLLFILAQIPDSPELEAMKNTRKSSQKLFGTDITIVLGAALVLTAALFFWAFFLRKRPKHMRGALVVERADKHSRETGTSGRRKRRKRRPDHPDNWGRNPTLEETGGLPPERQPEPEEPPSGSTTPPAR